jgi:peroxiredoxin
MAQFCGDGGGNKPAGHGGWQGYPSSARDAPLPRIFLPATTGAAVCLADESGLSVLIVYPWTGRPGHPNPPNWDYIPGAHGSTPELQGFRDHAADFTQLLSSYSA